MKLSIIIIEYHCMEDVFSCLRSIEAWLGPYEHECVVLSNSGYTEDVLEKYRAGFGAARLVPAGGNLGYAGGVNAALREVNGDYVYILNPDCLLTDAGAIDIMEKMAENPSWGIAGPKVVDEKGVIQPSCRRFPRPWTFFMTRTSLSKSGFGRRETARYFMQDFAHDDERDVDWVSGGALIARRDAVEKLGGMDQRYFLYMEDVDLCRAFNKHGFIVKYCPISTVIHSGQHASVKGGLKVLLSRNFRWHITSLAKYFVKWGLSG